MNPEIKALLISRLKAFGWRVLCAAGVMALAFGAEQFKLFNLPPLVSSLIGLLIADGTAWLTAHQAMFGNKKV